MVYIRTIFLLCSVLLLIPFTAMAQSDIAVVDLQKILSESLVGKNIQKQMQTQKELFLTELAEKEKVLRDQEKALMAERESLPKEEFAKKAQIFEQSLGETRRLAQTQKRDMDKAYTKAMVQVQNALTATVSALADEKGYTLVLSRLNVIVAKDSADITQEALKRLDKALSQVPLDIKSD